MEDYDAVKVGTHPRISFLKKGPPQSANPTALSLTFREVTLITEAMTECVPFSYVLIFLLLIGQYSLSAAFSYSASQKNPTFYHWQH